MWAQNWRDDVWGRLGEPWDIIVIGGGITGAGILREATRLGLRTLLVEQRDFAWGTSSRSSKLVHGGLRYLQHGDVKLTWESVQEREQLLAEGPGLIDPLGFLLPTYKGDRPGRWIYEAGLTVYDMLALQWSHRYYSADDFRMMAPHVAADHLRGGFAFGDAQTDDARLVLRVIREAVAEGGVALNYATAEGLLRGPNGVEGIRLHDQAQGRVAEVYAQVVINATGAWADRLRGQVGAEPRIRPLRGSHLIFPAWRLPAAQAVSFLHPVDRRPVFIFPWEGNTLVGTTDVDHGRDLDEEPGISPEEVAYLMTAIDATFPSLAITLDDVVSTFAGVRPVIGHENLDPSEESRDHVVWMEEGLLTVTGGKLTTFRVIALDALKAVRHRLPEMPPLEAAMPVLNAVDVPLPADDEVLTERCRQRLLGRYGADAPALVAAARPGELEPIAGTPYLWAELRWAARAEGVVHLEDLLLRRVRLGLLLPQGGLGQVDRIRAICQPELGWDDGRWAQEVAAYQALWRCCYGLPPRERIPDWRPMVTEAREKQAVRLKRRRQRRQRSTLGAGLGVAALLAVAVGWWWWRRPAGAQGDE